MQPGWTLLDSFWLDNESDIGVVMIVDEQGRFRWYHQRPGIGFDSKIIDEGILIGSFQVARSTIVDWDGRILWEAPFSMHHDIILSPWNDNHLLYLGDIREGCPQNTRESTVNEFDRTRQETWTWSICDYYTPPVVRPAWSHINTVTPFAGERALLISPRDQDLLMKIDRDSNEIVWMLGERGDFEMAEQDYFIHQHSPEIQPDGNILLYDNGTGSRRGYSRAIELDSASPRMGSRIAHGSSGSTSIPISGRRLAVMPIAYRTAIR
jgi:hypothetical protein